MRPELGLRGPSIKEKSQFSINIHPTDNQPSKKGTLRQWYDATSFLPTKANVGVPSSVPLSIVLLGHRLILYLWITHNLSNVIEDLLYLLGTDGRKFVN